VIKIIPQSETVEAARANLMTVFSLSQVQAQAILDMPLRRLAHLEQQKIVEEYASVVKDISYLEDLLANPKKVLFLVKQDADQLKSKYGDKRHTLITEEEVTEFRQEDLVPHQKVIVTLSGQGFIKRLPGITYRLQDRGGRGVVGMVTREDDLLRHILAVDTHDNLLFFTKRGKVYCLKCYEIPEDSSRTAKGISMVNLLPIDLKDEVTAILAIRYQLLADNSFLLLATKAGELKKTSLDEFSSIRRNGLIAMGLKNDDELVSARIATDLDELILVSQNGRAIRFKVKNLRTASRTSGGVHGIRLTDDCVVGMDVIANSPHVIASGAKQSQEAYLLTVTQKGFGKLTSIKSYPIQQRGGKGIRAHKASDKIGKIVAARLVNKEEGYLVMLSTAGNVECIPIEQISVQSRNGRGVHLMALAEGDSVVSITIVGSLARQNH